MRLLDIVNRARRECGVSGAALPTLQNGLTAEGQRFVDWAADAWNDLQVERPDWEWMRKPFTFNTTQGVAHYARANVVPDCATWKVDSLRCYPASMGPPAEQILPVMGWDTWRDIYQFGAMRVTTGIPAAAAVEPDKSMSLGPVPDAVYTVLGEYWREPTALSADFDDPAAAGNDFPMRFHMLLVYDVMERYAEYESAGEVLQRAVAGKKRLRNRLLAQYLRTVTWGPPLA